MSRCLEFYDAMEKNPDFCSLDPSTRSNIKFYNELRKKIGVHIKDRRFVVDHFTEGAARAISSNAKDDETRTKALNYVIDRLKLGEIVTAGDLENAIKGWNTSSCQIKEGGRGRPKKQKSTSSKDFTNVKSDTTSADDNPPEAPPQSLGQQIRSDEMKQADANQKYVHPGPAGINPVVINDTHRESPFKTAAQVKAGIAGEMFPDKRPDPAGVSIANQERIKREEMELIAEELLDLMPQGTKTMAAEIMRAHPSFKIKDVFYHGVAALHEKESKGGRR